MSDNSSRKPRKRKAPTTAKPYPDFPLQPHPSGAWQKRIRGKIHYFGRWARQVNGKLEKLPGDDWWKPALELYKAQADDLHAGRTPRILDANAKTIRDLCNEFLTAKKNLKDSGELSKLTFTEYRRTTDRLIDQFGKDTPIEDLGPSDFRKLRAEIAKSWGPVRLGNEITRVKSVFKFAFDNGMIEKPVRFGSEFKKPDKSVLRRNKAAKGKKMLEAEEIQKLLDAACVQMKAMVLLGVNCGFGNTDLANLTQSAVNLDAGWIDFPRPKTGIDRRCPLWHETAEAIREAIANRPDAKADEDEDCVFLTQGGRRWVRITAESRTDAVSVKFRELAKKAKVHRQGIGPYTLRHVFQTVADGARDPVAVKCIMGHADGTMSGVYRESVEDANLQAVASHVRQWLFGHNGNDGKPATDSTPPRDTISPNPGEEQGDDTAPTLRLFVG